MAGLDFRVSWCLFKSISCYFSIMFISMFSYFMSYQNIYFSKLTNRISSCISQYVSCVLQDPKYFKSQKTGRGQLKEGWRETHQPIMCSYKLVTVKFEVWGLQTRVEQFVHKVSDAGAVPYPPQKWNASGAEARGGARPRLPPDLEQSQSARLCVRTWQSQELLRSKAEKNSQ